mgnify:CR=1 FL=1
MEQIILRSLFKFNIIFLLFFSCNSKNTNNFINLKDAYVNWHFKNHITSDFDYSHDYFKRYNQKLSHHYVEDLNRFDLELSQINISRLKKNQEIDYNIIKNNIVRNLNEINMNNKNADDFISDIYFSYYQLINNSTLNYKKIMFINQHLHNTLIYMNNYKNIIYYDNHSSENINIDKLTSYLKEIPELLNLDEINNQSILNKIDLVINKLNKFEYWYNYEYEKVHIDNDKIDLNEFNDSIDDFFSTSPYSYDDILNLIESKILSLHYS